MKMLNLFLEIYVLSPLCFRNAKLIVTANAESRNNKNRVDHIRRERQSNRQFEIEWE